MYDERYFNKMIQEQVTKIKKAALRKKIKKTSNKKQRYRLRKQLKEMVQ